MWFVLAILFVLSTDCVTELRWTGYIGVRSRFSDLCWNLYHKVKFATIASSIILFVSFRFDHVVCCNRSYISSDIICVWLSRISNQTTHVILYLNRICFRACDVARYINNICLADFADEFAIVIHFYSYSYTETRYY